MRKYIIPLLFFISTLVMIPKQAYYKKEKVDLKIELSEPKAKGAFRIRSFNNIFLGKNSYSFGQEGLNESFENNVLDKAIIRVRSKNGYLKKISLNGKEIELGDKLKIIELKFKNIKKFYNFSLMNTMSYIFFMLLVNIYYFKDGVNFSKKNIVNLLVGIYILSLAVNQEWSSKILGAILSYSFLDILFNKDESSFDKVNVSIGLLLIFSFISEYFAYKNYSQTYIYFQNTLLMILVVNILKIDLEEKEILKKYLKSSIILAMLINLISPLAMSGIYVFTFGLLSTILLLDSINNIFELKKLSKLDVSVNVITVILSLYSLIFSDRRTMMLALLFFIIFRVSIEVYKRNKKFLLIVSIFIFSTVIVLKSSTIKNENLLIKKIQSIFKIKGDSSNYQRVLMWRRGPSMILENPILGIGVDSFYKESQKESYKKISHPDERFLKIFNHIHNEYLHQFISRGIFAGALFWGLWIYMLKSIRKSKDKKFDIILLILYGVYGIFDSYSVRVDSVFLYLFVGSSFFGTLEKAKKNTSLDKLSYILTLAIFLIALYFNKRFRYYFLISLVLYVGYYFYKKRKRVDL